LRYYYASKLTNSIDDIDLSIGDFVSRTNSDLVGKFANLASRSGPMLTSKLDSQLGQLDEQGKALISVLAGAQEQIIRDYENLNYAAAVRTQKRFGKDAGNFNGGDKRRTYPDYLLETNFARICPEGREVPERG
ncbi:MAG: class I tRNA ligase family protein, partial [Planctomycetota bacterium]